MIEGNTAQVASAQSAYAIHPQVLPPFAGYACRVEVLRARERALNPSTLWCVHNKLLLSIDLMSYLDEACCGLLRGDVLHSLVLVYNWTNTTNKRAWSFWTSIVLCCLPWNRRQWRGTAPQQKARQTKSHTYLGINFR